MGERCKGTCDLPAAAIVGKRYACKACGYEYIPTTRWAVGALWEPAWAVEPAQPEGQDP